MTDWTETELSALRRAYASGTTRVSYDGKSVDYGSAEDLLALDQLRPLFLRITALARRAEDTEMALGSDIYKATLDAYRFAKAAGKGAALDELSEQAAVRFAGQGKRGSVSNFVFKAVLIRPGLLRQGEKNRLTAPSPG